MTKLTSICALSGLIKALSVERYALNDGSMSSTHTQSCFTYTVWTFFCSRVLKKVEFFKPLPFPLKIVLGADFVSVFPLNSLLHFETDNNIPKCLLLEEI